MYKKPSAFDLSEIAYLYSPHQSYNQKVIISFNLPKSICNLK